MLKIVSKLCRFIINPRKFLVDFVKRVVKSDLPPVFKEMLPPLIKEMAPPLIKEIATPREIVSLANPMMRAVGYWGYSDSTYSFPRDEKLAIAHHFQHFEKFQVALSVAASYPGGDYLEFGSHDLYTLRNMLAAFDIGDLDKSYPETQFYAFDIYGQSNDKVLQRLSKYEEVSWYFDDFTQQGNLYQHHKQLVEEFNLFKDRTHLIQGFFEETLPHFELKNKIGFAFLDCNILPSYEYVLEWLFDKIDIHSFIYFDEYWSEGIYSTIEHFNEKLKEERRINLVFVRSVAAVGALFRVFPCPSHPQAEILRSTQKFSSHRV